jgi:hypothetical protein
MDAAVRPFGMPGVLEIRSGQDDRRGGFGVSGITVVDGPPLRVYGCHARTSEASSVLLVPSSTALSGRWLFG